MTTATQEVATREEVVQNSIELFRTAPQVMALNKGRSDKALVVGKNIIEEWQRAWSITDEAEKLIALQVVDERSNTYLSNCNAAGKQMKEARAAITQMMDEFKKMFTEAENAIDKAKAGTIPASVQQNRDAYAKELHQIQERKRQEEARKAAIAKERIEIRYQAETKIKSELASLITRAKEILLQNFSKVTLEKYEAGLDWFRRYVPQFEMSMLPAPVLNSTYLDQEELTSIRTEVMQSMVDALAAEYNSALASCRDEIVEKLPSHKAFLLEQKRIKEEAEQADAERKAELQAQAAAAEQARQQREQEDRERLAKEEADRAEQARQEAELKKQGEHTMVMFEQEAALAEVAPSPESRQGYEITVLHAAGYVQIFQCWFEGEGKNLPLDKMGNTKLDQMKAWCEKQAHKTGTLIESKFLKYEETFKAINKKK